MAALTSFNSRMPKRFTNLLRNSSIKEGRGKGGGGGGRGTKINIHCLISLTSRNRKIVP